MNEAKRLNIQSTAKTTHHLFGRISYKPWYAIAEFVDNSTQSFFSNKERFDNQKRVDVIVQYKNDEKVLTVTDNAFGMDLDELSVALNLEGGLENKTGRNEFGVGMKTAAGWFGKKWSVTTTKYNSGKQYVAIVDIDNLENEIVIYEEDVPLEQHGTTIRIEKITKGLTAPRTVSKIKDVLSSMYRRDINSGEVYIEYNRDPIYFEDYPVLSNFRDTEWKKDVNFEFEFEGKLYHVDGFIAIMDPGSFVNAGLALFRRNRVIIGGPDMNYKPAEIFGQQQSQKSLKLFGELNMDDFPVNQAKDGFVWDDGLEDEFISCLKENIQDYIKIADISKQDRAKEEMYSQKTTEKVSEEVKTALEQVQNSFEEQGKYDFVLGGLVLEIKTTSHDDLNVQIKHDQLYSREDVYLGAVCIEKSNAGFTLNDLIKQINTIEEFSKNLRFQIALGNELKKISPDEANQLRFDIKKIRFFKNTDIATISDIPEYLSDITYRCRLEGQKTVSIEDMISRI